MQVDTATFGITRIKFVHDLLVRCAVERREQGL
jgi:hypothetical protein